MPRRDILVQPRAIKADELRYLREYVRTARHRDSLVSNMDDTESEDVEWVIDKRIRDTQEVQLSKAALSKVESIIRRAVRDHINPFYGVRIRDWETPQILRYGKSGHYIPHVDAETLFTDDDGIELWEKTLDRDISVVYFLNDDFSAGELVFPKLRMRIVPKAGTLVCFPSDHHYIHGVKPVTKGQRYSLVTWMRVRGMPLLETINNESWLAYRAALPRQFKQPQRITRV